MTEWRFEDRDCPICGASREAARVLGCRGGAAHHLGLGVETRIVRCRSCHGVYQRPTAIPLVNPYLEEGPATYFQHHDSAAKVASGVELARTAERLLGSRGRMLELGCGRGELLGGAAAAGWEVAGVDMTASYAAIARSEFSVEVEVTAIESAHALDRQWDVIVLAAVLEHVYEPARLLQRVAAALRPGGLVYLDVPNECALYNRLGNFYLRLRGRNWATNLSPTFPPFHVVGFCPYSLRRVLVTAGLKPVVLQQYRMRSYLKPAGTGLRALAEQLGVDAALSLGQLVGMGAGLLCWARKA